MRPDHSPASPPAPGDVVRLLRALSDPTRLRILALLRRGDLCVSEIQEALHLSQPLISRHLAYLRRIGLVSRHRDGLWMHYERAACCADAFRPLLDSAEECIARSATGRADRSRLDRLRPCCEHMVAGRAAPMFIRWSRSSPAASAHHGPA